MVIGDDEWFVIRERQWTNKKGCPGMDSPMIISPRMVNALPL
jgi:hypothetical protein